MNKFITFILCLHCVFTSAWAEGNDHTSLNPSDTSIVGHVLNKRTGEYLPFVSVHLRDTTIDTTTDATGRYYMKNLPEGKYTLVMKSIGHKAEEKTVTLKKGKTLEIDFSAEEDAISLDGTTVSANRSKTTHHLAPSLINVLGSKVFETTHAISLADDLNFQSGVRVENSCQNCDFQQIRINDLEDLYAQILMDSRPIFSTLTGIYGLEQVLANVIERVGMVRGGDSVSFGSSVTAGTINIITKEPMRNSAQIVHSLTIIEGNRPDNNTTVNASLMTDDHKAGIYLFGQSHHRASYDHGGDGYPELDKLETKTLGFCSYLKTSDYSRLTFECHNISEFQRDGNPLDLPPHKTDIAERIDHQINEGDLKFGLFSRSYHHWLNAYTSAQHTRRQSYYGAGEDPNAYGSTTDMTFIGDTQYSYERDKCLFVPATFMRGAGYSYDDLQDEMFGYHRTIVQTVHISSAFAQNEWKSDRWSLLIGGRLDKHNVVDHVIFSPHANVRFDPTKDINLRMSYSSGFQAPRAFDEDLHVTTVGGDVAIIQISPDLKEENSQSVSASMDFYRRFGPVQVNFLVEGSYTDLRNVFILEKIGCDEDNNLLMERRNGKGTRVIGINLEGRMACFWTQVQAGATLQRNRYKEAEQWSENPSITPQKKMFRSPDVYGYSTSTFTPVKRLSASLTGTYTGSMLVQHLAGYIPEGREEKTRDFSDLNLKLSYDFPIFKSATLQASAGTQNILNPYQDGFDRGTHRDAGYICDPGIPRSYFVGCKISY